MNYFKLTLGIDDWRCHREIIKYFNFQDSEKSRTNNFFFSLCLSDLSFKILLLIEFAAVYFLFMVKITALFAEYLKVKTLVAPHCVEWGN